MAHPAFDRANLRKLPIQLRNPAIAAANGSVDDLEGLFVALTITKVALGRQDVLYNLVAAFSPAINEYNPETLRRAAEGDNVIVQTQTISSVFWSLRNIEQIVVQKALPIDAFQLLWPRIWTFVQLVHDLRTNEALPEVLSTANLVAWIDDGCICGFGCLTWMIATNEGRVNELHRLALRAPGMFTIIGRIWARTVANPDMEPLYSIVQLLTVLTPASIYSDNQQPLREIVLGAGGDWDAMAKLIVDHMQRHCNLKRQGLQHCREDLTSLDVLLEFLSAARLEPAFLDALIVRGIIPVLVEVLVNVTADHLNDDYLDVPTAAWMHLMQTFVGARFQEGMPQALRAGFIEASLRYAALSRAAYDDVQTLWNSQLPMAAMNRKMIPRLVRAFGPKRHTRLRGLVESLRSPPLTAQLDNLSALMDQRRQFFADYKAGKLTMYLGCDNMQCGAVLYKSSIKQCGGCFTSHYCSRACQKYSWQYEHKRACAPARARHMLNLQHMSSGAVSQSFLRALLNSRYYALRETLLLRSVRLLWNANIAPRAGTALPPLYVLFDAAKQPGWIKVSLHLEPPEGVLEGYALAIRDARAPGPRGKWGLHFLKTHAVADGGLQFVPLRRENARWEEGLEEILAEIPRKSGAGQDLDVELHREKVQAIIAELGAETH